MFRIFTIQLLKRIVDVCTFYKLFIDKPLYNLYTKNMNNSRLTFNSSTNFTLPIDVIRVLQSDAYYYGFIKNRKPNISGFLNNLIPTLSDYQEDLFNQLLKFTNGDEQMAKICAQSIHSVYLYPFTFHDDGTANVPFRISKDKYDDFIIIHDKRLAFYNTDFTNYVRTLLSEYASKTLGQREYLYAFNLVSPLRDAIREGNQCRFYTNENTFTFFPVSIELSPIYGHNHIIGIDSYNHPQAIRLSTVHKILVLQENMEITKTMCEKIINYLDKIYEEEYNECMG